VREAFPGGTGHDPDLILGNFGAEETEDDLTVLIFDNSMEREKIRMIENFA